MVADVHRTLVYGGIFAYPGSKVKKIKLIICFVKKKTKISHICFLLHLHNMQKNNDSFDSTFTYLLIF